MHFGEDVSIKIGKFCSIAPRQVFYLGGNHRTDWVTTYPFGHIYNEAFPKGLVNGANGHPRSKGDIVVGNDVWIGRSCSLMSGVQIGDGACIAANSVVTKSVPPYAIVGGNPARVLRVRFDPLIVQSLLELRWWDRGDDYISEIVPYLQQEPSEQSIKAMMAILGSLSDRACSSL